MTDRTKYVIHCLGCNQKYMLIDFPRIKQYSQHVCGALNSVEVPRDENGGETKEEVSYVRPNQTTQRQSRPKLFAQQRQAFFKDFVF